MPGGDCRVGAMMNDPLHDSSMTPPPSGMVKPSEGGLVTLVMDLSGMENISVAVPTDEWRNLISGYKLMPAHERAGIKESIRRGVKVSPFPTDGQTLMDEKLQRRCDTFVTDCILLAAMAEVLGKDTFAGTALKAVTVQAGNAVKGKLN